MRALKTRSDPEKLRLFARLLREKYPHIARELENAAIDIETMKEDLEMERDLMRDMVDELVLGKYVKGLK